MLNELAKDIHNNACAHGWWDEERSFGEIIALCHSELSEALEEYRDNKPPMYLVEGKPEGIGVELADCIIRILDYCEKAEINIDEIMEIRRAGNESYTLPVLIVECHCLLAGAYKDMANFELYFAECINLIYFWCTENQIDIDRMIEIKHEYNKTRPYKHGGKVI